MKSAGSAAGQGNRNSVTIPAFPGNFIIFLPPARRNFVLSMRAYHLKNPAGPVPAPHPGILPARHLLSRQISHPFPRNLPHLSRQQNILRIVTQFSTPRLHLIIIWKKHLLSDHPPPAGAGIPPPVLQDIRRPVPLPMIRYRKTATMPSRHIPVKTCSFITGKMELMENTIPHTGKSRHPYRKHPQPDAPSRITTGITRHLTGTIRQVHLPLQIPACRRNHRDHRICYPQNNLRILHIYMKSMCLRTSRNLTPILRKPCQRQTWPPAVPRFTRNPAARIHSQSLCILLSLRLPQVPSPLP